jgi:energy-coupling factor transporter transmembrane protein EcfT
MRPGALRAESLAPLLLGAMAGSLVAGRLETALACVAVAAAAGAAVQAPWPSPRWWGIIASGSAISILLNLYLNSGRPLVLPAIFGHAATAHGLRLGVLLALRVLGASLALHALRALWPGERAADEIAGLLRPLERLRVPVRRARAVLGLALRFAPLLGEEARRISTLQRLRAGGVPRGPREWLERRRAVVVPALVSTLERAERVALALEARHYRLRAPAAGARWPAGWSGAGLALAGAALLWRAHRCGHFD